MLFFPEMMGTQCFDVDLTVQQYRAVPRLSQFFVAAEVLTLYTLTTGWIVAIS